MFKVIREHKWLALKSFIPVLFFILMMLPMQLAVLSVIIFGFNENGQNLFSESMMAFSFYTLLFLLSGFLYVSVQGKLEKHYENFKDKKLYLFSAKSILSLIVVLPVLYSIITGLIGKEVIDTLITVLISIVAGVYMYLVAHVLILIEKKCNEKLQLKSNNGL